MKTFKITDKKKLQRNQLIGISMSRFAGKYKKSVFGCAMKKKTSKTKTKINDKL